MKDLNTSEKNDNLILNEKFTYRSTFVPVNRIHDIYGVNLGLNAIYCPSDNDKNLALLQFSPTEFRLTTPVVPMYFEYGIGELVEEVSVTVFVFSDADRDFLIDLIIKDHAGKLHYLDRGIAVNKFMDRTGIMQKLFAVIFDRGNSTISNFNRLSDLSPQVYNLIKKYDLPEHVCRNFLTIDDPDIQLYIITKIHESNANSRVIDKSLSSIKRKMTCNPDTDSLKFIIDSEFSRLPNEQAQRIKDFKLNLKSDIQKLRNQKLSVAVSNQVNDDTDTIIIQIKLKNRDECN